MRPQPYFNQGDVTLYVGDSRVIVPQLVLPEVGLILTDPPYGVGMERGDSKRGERVIGDDLPFDPSFLLSLGLPAVLFGANAYADKLPPSKGWLVWDKTFPDMARHSQAELAWTNFVKGIRIHRQAYHGFMRKADGWLHPTQKPVALFRWILNLPWTPPGLVLDPFMGAGGVVRAAMECGRPVIGIDIEQEYVDATIRRLAQAVLPLAVAE